MVHQWKQDDDVKSFALPLGENSPSTGGGPGSKEVSLLTLGDN